MKSNSNWYWDRTEIKQKIYNYLSERQYSKILISYVDCVVTEKYEKEFYHYLEHQPRISEKEILLKLYNSLPPLLFFRGGLPEEYYTYFKKDYIKNNCILYNEHGDKVDNSTQKWIWQFLYDCSLDKEWEDKFNNAIICVELRDLIWYFEQNKKEYYCKILETDNIKDAKNYMSNPNCFVMIYVNKTEGLLDCCDEISDGSNITLFSILKNYNILKTYQIGIVYPKNKGDQYD